MQQIQSPSFVLMLVVLLCGRIALSQNAPNADQYGDDVRVEEEGDNSMKEAVVSEKDLNEEEEVKVQEVGPSPDADCYLLFTNPVKNLEFPATEVIRFLVGFWNKGSDHFTVDSMEASFRYPMDFSFYIQNYTPVAFNRDVNPNTEATFDYSFMTSDTFAGRPFGFVVNLNYRNSNGTNFVSTVFNQTITVIEDETGINPETIFLYVVFVCLGILMLLLLQQLISNFRRKHAVTKRSTPIEMGTSNMTDVDFEWIPKEILDSGTIGNFISVFTCALLYKERYVSSPTEKLG
ncbi:unnamed protein product [Soboliphyme baturini]|uniref:Translocon-associated protein subunit alpha n=1 Tax=Soboliphyme baturini TaxID=241478 RepID=A0A183IRM3_9BILA|nr:unnamed protein product [Soboliphyme baturini]